MLQRCLFRSRQTALGCSTRCYRTKGSKNKKSSTSTENGSTTLASSPGVKDQTWKRPVVIAHGSEHHNDLTSFLKYAKREQLSDVSTVYTGTHYEYTAAASLARLGFDVVRTGKTADFGIDLLGWWRLPASPEPVKVLLQCKAHAKKLGPQNVRELEGSFAGAPAHWQGGGVMGFLVAPSQSTKGMRDAMIKSSLPLGFLQITREGKILQMLWNHQANSWGLTGFGVATKFNPEGADGLVDEEIAVTWNGRALNLDTSVSVRSDTKSSKVKGDTESKQHGE